MKRGLITEERKRLIEKKARLFDVTKERVIARIVDNIRIASEKLKAAEQELLDEAEFEFGVNPFASFLIDIGSENAFVDDDRVESILSQDIQKSFGPSEESFCSLLREIDLFKTLEKKGRGDNKQGSLDLIPKNIKCTDLSWDSITLSWDEVNCYSDCLYEIEIKSLSSVKNIYNTISTEYTISELKPKTDYYIRVRAVTLNNKDTIEIWSNPIRIQTTPQLFDDGWKECSQYVDEKRKYSVDPNNNRVAVKPVNDGYSTVIGNTSLPLNRVISWNIKILESQKNDGNGIFIEVAPSDIDQNEIDNSNKCGWYFNCYRSSLCSGPPHNYNDKEYGLVKVKGEYVYTGDSVGVVVNTSKGELSFILKEVNLGIAYSGIPLDKPLVPCVFLCHKNDSVEMSLSKTKEIKVINSIITPSNLSTKSVSWNSITIKWDVVGGASFYQIEVDGNKPWDVTATNTFTKRGFPTETEHSFRIRAVNNNGMSEWSDIVKGRTIKESFKSSAWKDCPDNIDEELKYSIDLVSPKIATKLIYADNILSTVIGNTPIPLNEASQWNINLLKSKENDGSGIYIGVSPFDINRKEKGNFNKCGWYFNCLDSMLYSGPPHNYRNKEYGPRKGDGEYVHTGGSVGVVMDTTKGELSFVLSGVNLGIAFEGIPLDKPLVPCTLLYYNGDSIALDISEVRENVDDSIPVPPNITAKSVTWDSITITWDAVEGAEFYQIEVDNSVHKLITTNTFTKRKLLPESEHSLRVRAMKDNSVSKWSDVMKGRTQKELFEASGWNDYFDVFDKNRKFFIEWDNSRIATATGFNGCTIIGNTFIPPNKITSWSIKILKSNENERRSINNNGNEIYIGVTPFDINLNKNDNYEKCGWYNYCWDSTLYSGQPHNYEGKKYGPRKGNGEYIHTGDSVGVVMDTSKGELSFVVNRVNFGVAFEGIPLDKPLVPCVVLKRKGGSVELDTTEVKENVGISILTPTKIELKDGKTWDSIILTWEYVNGATFYQIEVDNNKKWIISTSGMFTQRGFLPDTEHSFRIRSANNNAVSEWSDALWKKIQVSFKTSWWKEYPNEKKIYSVDENNLRIATSISGHCIVIGNTSLPPNKISQWNVKILESKNIYGVCFYIGVAPFDIDQFDCTFNRYGWYYDCSESTLYSGPPHNYGYESEKVYGPKKDKWDGIRGKYVHKGDTIGVVMDTVKGDLSFNIKWVKYGIAFYRIPLDKPLVPCVVLSSKGDSVELTIY